MKIINFQILTISDLVLLSLLVITFIFQIYYLLRYYLKLVRKKDIPSDTASNPVTIIIPVRNEENRIREILNKFEEQQFTDYQLLVINEHSEDNTYGMAECNG